MIDYDVSDGICVLRLNSPPLNTISLALLEALSSSIDRAVSDSRVAAIVITGDANHFSAGADVSLFEQVNSAQDAVRISRVFQDAFRDVEDSAKPVVAAVAGKVMGSALELAMSCHYRVCAAGTTFTMPEVKLGINPGAGGTQRLPRLVGADLALKMLLGPDTISAERALEAGLIDAVADGSDSVAAARRFLAKSPPIRMTRTMTSEIDDEARNKAAFGDAGKVASAGRPEIIAPQRILRAVKVGITESFDAGLLEEQRAFADCSDTPGMRNKIYTFFATRATRKAPDLDNVSPKEIGKAAVIGMGSMGSGIAHALAIAGVPVSVLDLDPASLEKGLAGIRKSVEKRVKQGKMTRERADGLISLVQPAADWSGISDADIVMEAVFEDADVKRSVLSKIEAVCSADAILATNTSTISLDDLAADMRNPGRLIGMHFFNPAHRMPLVEVIRRDGAAAAAVATGLAFAKRIRKTPVLVRNRVGFLVNRIFLPYLKEAFLLLEDGAAAEDIDAAMVEFGFPMGPLVLIDMAGIDILAFTDNVMSRAFDGHKPLSRIARLLVERGCCGQKTGSGVYEYQKGDYTPHGSDSTAAVIDEVRRETGVAARAVGSDEIRDRLIMRMVSEAFRVLEEGIVQRESDVDAAMVLGTGFPDFRGGVVKYARDIGLEKIVPTLDGLTEKFGERFAACSHLREMRGDS